MEIQKILHELQKKISVPKSQRNSFGNYNYRSCEDIVEAVKKILPDEVILTLEDKLVMLGDRFYIKATATISKGDEKISTTSYAREEATKKGMDSSQITGSASSYARKYALNGLLLIDDTKDADTQDNTEKEKIQKNEKHEEMIANITDIGELKKYYKKHEGEGKEFAKLVTARKKELEHEEA